MLKAVLDEMNINNNNNNSAKCAFKSSKRGHPRLFRYCSVKSPFFLAYIVLLGEKNSQILHEQGIPQFFNSRLDCVSIDLHQSIKCNFF